MTIEPDSPSTLRHAAIAVRAELALLAKAFLRTLGVVMLVAAVAVMVLAAKGAIEDGEAANLVSMIPFAFVYGAFLGFWPGVFAGSARVGWVMAGPFLIVPLVLVPFAVLTSFWLLSGMLAGLGEDVWTALVAAGAEHEWLVAELGPVARVGPVALIFALPLLLVDLGAVALDPGVLFALLMLFLGTSAVFLLGFVPSAGASSVVVIGAYVRRVRARHREVPAQN